MLAVNGFEIHKGWLDPPAQAAMAADVARVAAAAPFFAPLTPWGKPMSVAMTSAGRYGWFTDRSGYRYVDRHPSGAPWPPIPASVLGVWRALVSRGADARLLPRQPLRPDGAHGPAPRRRRAGLRLAGALDQPRRPGGVPHRRPPSAPTRPPRSCSSSGDVVVFGGDARLAYHGIDRIRAGGSRLLPEGGRINLTLPGGGLIPAADRVDPCRLRLRCPAGEGRAPRGPRRCPRTDAARHCLARSVARRRMPEGERGAASPSARIGMRQPWLARLRASLTRAGLARPDLRWQIGKNPLADA